MGIARFRILSHLHCHLFQVSCRNPTIILKKRENLTETSENNLYISSGFTAPRSCSTVNTKETDIRRFYAYCGLVLKLSLEWKESGVTTSSVRTK